jgi:DNA-binding NarL/FixJ family response regulator
MTRSLSPREREVLDLLSAPGGSVQETARQLGISEGTVKSYVQRAKWKQNVDTLAQLVRVVYGRKAA